MTLVVLGLAWLSGFAGVAVWGLPPWTCGAFWVVVSPFPWARLGRRGLVVTLVCAALATAGALRFESWADAPPPSLATYVGSELTLEGAIVSEPSPGLTTARFVFEASALVRDGQPVPIHGRAILTVDQFASHLPGTLLRVSGELELPPELDAFDYRGYLARRGIVGTMLFPRVQVLEPAPRWHPQRLAVELRLRIDAALARALPEPEASLGSGILIGYDGNLPRPLYDDFRATGLAHIVAVSGTNVTLVTAIVFALVTPVVGRKRALWFAAAMAATYVLAAGASPSVVRAGVMAGVFLAGSFLGRQQSSLAALAAASIGMTALQPGIALDVGFQLSLAATAGLIAFAPWIERGLLAGLGGLGSFGGDWIPRPVVQVLAFTLAATIATLPITWVTFGRISLIGPLANILVEPLFVLAFALTAVTAAAAVVWEPAGWAVGMFAYYPLALMCQTASTLASIPGASIPVPRGGAEPGLLAMAVLVVAAWPAARRFAPPVPPAPVSPRAHVVRRACVAMLAGPALLAVYLVTFAPTGGPGHLQMTVLDVGQGDAILITTPHGKHILIDGGPSGIELARELSATLPHWDRQLHAVFLTHPQQDHVAGLAKALSRFDAIHVFDTGIASTTTADRLYRQRAPHRETARAGDRFEIDGVTIEVLWPRVAALTDELNDTSLVLRVEYGETSFLFTGDIEAPAQRQILAANNVRADVLKVPHHGSKTSTAEFFTAVGPAIALISAGRDNQFGHPAPVTLVALAAARVYRTDLDGRITIESDGTTLRVRTER